MGPRLGLLLASAALVATGCGASSSTTATDPSQSASRPSAGPIENAHVLPLVPIHAVAGQVSEQAVPLGTPAQLTAFVQQFSAPLVEQRVRSALEPALGQAGPDVVGAVVASGCDVPEGVTVTADGSGGVRIIAQKASSQPPRECLVPVTTVALVDLPSD
jgi:hypothetical protein